MEERCKDVGEEEEKEKREIETEGEAGKRQKGEEIVGPGRR